MDIPESSEVAAEFVVQLIKAAKAAKKTGEFVAVSDLITFKFLQGFDPIVKTVLAVFVSIMSVLQANGFDLGEFSFQDVAQFNNDSSVETLDKLVGFLQDDDVSGFHHFVMQSYVNGFVDLTSWVIPLVEILGLMMVDDEVS